jgi:hypothetical protein
MLVRYASAILTLAGTLALVLGLLSWAGTAGHLMTMHMPLGFLTVAALWVIGIAQAAIKGGSWLIAAYAVIVGAITIVLGLLHAALMAGEYHWVVQGVHLALGILTIGLGHMAAARYRKASAGE